MNTLKTSILALLCLLAVSATSQTVGVVLSGGGASGMAHIGVLKALEENNIPIDYITGTSMGALVGGLYAAGYSPDEIEAIFTSDQMKRLAAGVLDDKYLYYIKKKDDDASWVTFKVELDTLLEQSLPTNIISPVAIDFVMMELFSAASASSNYNFDSLFVPFRCIASDIEDKKQVKFKSGNLSTAIRASISYPFFIKPIKVDGKLLFDGGLYNNFPADIMCEDFNPDYVIGSNVSYNFPAPDEDNIISQVKSMLVSETDYTITCEKGRVIEPNVEDVGTFDFSKGKMIVDIGYQATLKEIDSINYYVDRFTPKILVEAEREKFNKSKPPIVFNEIYVNGVEKEEVPYIFKSLGFKQDSVPIAQLKKEYGKLTSDEKIKYVYPSAFYDTTCNRYKLVLDVKKESDLFVSFGGNFSSRPINEGFVGLQYNYLGKVGISLSGNSYFGKFYSSARTEARIDFPYKVPFYFSTSFTLNKWDYFKSNTTFFEDVKPSYLIVGDNYLEGKVGFPISYKGKIELGGAYFNLKNEYYQGDDFTSVDTADITEFTGNTAFIQYERNSLNFKQYANKGSLLRLKGRFVYGDELTLPGSTAIGNKTLYKNTTYWFVAKARYEKYFNSKHKLRFGIFADAQWSNQPFFQNYTATILATNAFNPIPESQTLFLQNLRSFSYGAGGLRAIFALNKNFQVRAEGFLFQPYQQLLDNQGNAKLGDPLSVNYLIGSGSIVYTTPLGPIAVNFNYYSNREESFSFLFHFGYILFNRNALH